MPAIHRFGGNAALVARIAQDMKISLALTAALFLCATALNGLAAELHVSHKGNDSNSGAANAPLRSIQRAAELAQAGDVITVHEGVYRERINPPRGGQSDAERIIYQAAPGEKVEIKGSEIVKNWTRSEGDTWKVVIANSFFGDFNPFADVIRGDWFDRRGRDHHTGAVYLNGHWLTEAAKLEDVSKPAGATPLWFARVDREQTTIWAQFNGVDPNNEVVEINVRRAVFYPDKPGRNFITVRGFAMRHAATPWAPPTAEQIGLIGTHWSRGWIIENNTISHSTCSGIALGKYGDQFDNTSANTAEGYVKTIERALARGWNKRTIGGHIVRNNHISHCEQAGIVGSLGPIFSVITGNTIHDIHVRGLFSGAEMAGIKLHGAIDVEISRNHIYRTCRGLWLDWMAQGTRVSANLFHDNAAEDLFVEVNHGPFVVDNNIFLSATTLLDMSQGGAYAHNLIAGRMIPRPELSRATPFHKPHSTEVAGLKNIAGGDNRFHNNVFVGGTGLTPYDGAKLPSIMSGNVFFNGAKPSKHEAGAMVRTDVSTAARMNDAGGLALKLERFWLEGKRTTVTSESLGTAAIPNVAYKDTRGQSLRIDSDYFGKPRGDNPTVGPFENIPVEGVKVTR
jgi:alpha-N-arabinofuranosidase